MKGILAATYFPGGLPLEYRRRGRVSLPCSGWERVGHRRYDHQKLDGAYLVKARPLNRIDNGRVYSCGRTRCTIAAVVSILALFDLLNQQPCARITLAVPAHEAREGGQCTCKVVSVLKPSVD